MVITSRLIIIKKNPKGGTPLKVLDYLITHLIANQEEKKTQETKKYLGIYEAQVI